MDVLKSHARVVGYCGLSSAFLILDLTICEHAAPAFSGIATIALIPFVCVIWGLIYLMAFSRSEKDLITVESCMITGFWLTSLVLIFPVFLIRNPLAGALFVLAWIITALGLLIRYPACLNFIKVDRYSFFILLLVSLSMSMWSQTGILQRFTTSESVVFLPWSDHFVHASIIQRLYDCASLGIAQEFGLMAGIPSPCYHYGSYMMPVILRAVTDIPAINISTSFWLPLGAIFSGLAAFTLGKTFFGVRGGFAACAFVCLMPDSYMLGFSPGYFSYHFLGQTGAALYYAEAITAVGLSLIAKAINSGSQRILVAGFIPIFSTVVFKAHIFAVALPASAMWTIMFFPLITRKRRLFLMLFLISASMTSIYFMTDSGLFATSRPWGLDFFKGIFSGESPNDPLFFAWIFGWTQKTGAIFDDLLVGAVLLWIATLGPFLILGLMLTAFLKWKRSLNFVDCLPWLFLAVWTFMVMALPSNTYGNLDEFHHRPFHVVYYIFMIWLSSRLCQIILPVIVYHLPPRSVPLGLMIALLLIPWNFGEHVLRIGPCATAHNRFKIDRGLYESAKFIRSHGKPGDIFLDSLEDSHFNLVSGLSERRPFLSKPYHSFVTKHCAANDVVNYRQSVANALKNCHNADCVIAIAQTENLRWYLAHPKDNIPWGELNIIDPVFEFKGYRVFDFDGAFK